MEKITDEELLKELKKRFEMNRRMVQIHKDMMVDLQKVNKKLLNSEKVQSQFLSNMRNEINNPLTSIIGLSKELSFNETINNECNRKIEMIFSEAFKLEYQVQNIFVAGDLESGETELYITKVDVNSLTKSTIGSLKHISDKKNVKINYQYTASDDKVNFNTDPDKLKIIIINLLLNAIEFNKEGGIVKIDVNSTDSTKLIINVKDEGEGIAEEDMQKIFERFVQLDEGTTKKHQGQGMGLAVVKSLVEFMEGEIDVISKVDEGTEFNVIIPWGYIHDNAVDYSEDGNEYLFFNNGDGEGEII